MRIPLALYRLTAPRRAADAARLWPGASKCLLVECLLVECLLVECLLVECLLVECLLVECLLVRSDEREVKQLREKKPPDGVRIIFMSYPQHRAPSEKFPSSNNPRRTPILTHHVTCATQLL